MAAVACWHPPHLSPRVWCGQTIARLSLPARGARGRAGRLERFGVVRCAAAKGSVSAASEVVQPAREVDSLWRWLMEKGVASGSSAVKPALVKEGVGLVAQRDVRKGEEVVQIPRKMWITVETVKESGIGRFVEGQRPWVALAFFLISETANSNSSWRPYLDCLPQSLDSPLFWSDEELLEIQGTQLLGSTLSFREYVESEFDRVSSEFMVANPDVFDPKIFTLEAFLWAFGILRSRTFAPLTGEDLALVPLADFVNHGTVGSKERPCWDLQKGTGFFGSQDTLVLRTSNDCSAGDQILMDYGASKGNGQLALDYGFVDCSSNFEGRRSGESFTLTLEIPEADRFFDDKADIAELNKFGPSVSFELVHGEIPPEDMLTYLRLMVLDGPDAFLLEALFRESVWGHLSLPVSKENEEGICTAMLDGCRSALGGYSTTIDEDVRLLKDGIEDSRLEMAVIVRLGEKRILEELQGWFEAHLTRLDKLEYYAERRLRDLGLMDDKGFLTPWVFNE